MPDENIGVFVAGDGSDETGNGAPDRPYASVAKAVAAGKARVYLREGSYPIAATLELTGAVAIEGGFGDNFVRDCASDAAVKTVLTGRDAGVSPVIRVMAGADAALASLSVQTIAAAGTSPMAMPGVSLYGIVVQGGRMELDDVSVQAGDAGEGGEASPGAPAAGAVDCDGVSDCTKTGAPSTGAIGAAGVAATHDGDFGVEGGYLPAKGVAADDGAVGQNGSSGGASFADGFCVACAATSQAACSGSNSVPDTTFGDGRCGCGGDAGKAGGAGPGGGASVAVVVLGGGALSVGAAGARLLSGKGGDGAEGGEGGTGAPGSNGSQITEGATCPVATPDNPTPPCSWNGATLVCTPLSSASETFTSSDRGAAGGVGAKGGDGGHGAPGPGGPSIALVLVGDAITPTQGLTLKQGQGGHGAKGATGAAPDGEATAMKSY